MTVSQFPNIKLDIDKALKTRVAGSKRGISTRSSSQDLTAVNGMFSQYASLGYMLPWQVLDYVEILASFNPDYSQAVDNVRTLANSGHELYVDAGSELRSRKIKARLEAKSRTIQEQHGGIDGLIDKLLDQAATYGAMCGEWIVSEELDDVVDFADINPKTIRYKWNEDLYRYVPYQKVTGLQVEEARKRGQEVDELDSTVRLNELTFRYYAFDSAPGSPYGVPPFVASLFNIAIQRDMMDNMSQIVKKLGMLGMIDVSIEMLEPQPGETDEQYNARASLYLDDYAEVIELMVKDGGMVHYDDAVVKTQSLVGNAAGATNIFKQNEEQIFSGLKSMPSVQGRCVHPDTRILTADLRWVKAGDLFLDDELIGFDEDLGKGRGKGCVARMKRSIVENNKIEKMECLKVVTDKGHIIVSKEHPMVGFRPYGKGGSHGRSWINAENLRVNDKLNWFGEPWETERSYEAGYISGILDGEGSIGPCGSEKNGGIQFSQNPGLVLDESIKILKQLGYDTHVRPQSDANPCIQVKINGGKYETFRLLGSIRPHRLLDKAHIYWEGMSLKGSTKLGVARDIYATVLAVEDVGEQDVVVLQTSSRTFISEGLLSHNSFSTTETYAGVAYEIVIRNTHKYQRAAKRMIEAGYWLMASLWGESPDSISLHFKKNKDLARLEEAQAIQIEIMNAEAKWTMGIIDQSDVAQELGYNDPKKPLDEPPGMTMARQAAEAKEEPEEDKDDKKDDETKEDD